MENGEPNTGCNDILRWMAEYKGIVVVVSSIFLDKSSNPQLDISSLLLYRCLGIRILSDQSYFT